MNPEKATPLVGRLAPSPTGLLHLGHARTFLLAWWHLRSRHGTVLLRIEDLDGARCDNRFTDAIVRDLQWLGLDWDGPTYKQSAGLEAMHGAARSLLDRRLAYPCVCTRGDLRRALSAPHLGDREIPYPGLCRSRFASIAAAEATGKQAALRFLVSRGPVTFRDEVHGNQEFDVSAECGDFVIARKGGDVAYQLAVVVDDARQGVTEVHRGSDLLASTARQRLLQDALGLRQPKWIHFPLVTDRTGTRLAKRRDDLSLWTLRQRGVTPEEIVRWTAESAGMNVEHPRAARSLIADFNLNALSPVDLRVRDEWEPIGN